jgi:hypothetical protein
LVREVRQHLRQIAAPAGMTVSFDKDGSRR